MNLSHVRWGPSMSAVMPLRHLGEDVGTKVLSKADTEDLKQVKNLASTSAGIPELRSNSKHEKHAEQ